jgi:hypothetical protein
MDVPPEARRMVFSANNSTNVVLSLEQGTLAQPGDPAHWTSYLNNNNLYGNQANISLDQPLTIPNNWPWLPGYSYYLAVTNTSGASENFSFSSFGRAAASFPAILGGNYALNGSFHLLVTGQPGNYYIVQSSTNLMDWFPISTNTASFELIDPDATNYPMRFYRTVLIP